MFMDRSSGIKTEIRTITPKMARKMLENNPRNRNLSHSTIAAYQRDMKLGRWQINGEGIQFDRNGTLLNGQHRLNACIRADTSFQTLVVTNLPSKIIDTIDGGRKRTHADRLTMRGVKNATGVSSIARMSWSLAHKRIRMKELTPQDLDWFISTYPQIHDSAAKSYAAFSGMQACIGTIHLVGTLIGYEDRADAMIDVWKTGVPDYDGCAMHVIRERLLQSRGTTREPTREMRIRLVLSAWERFKNYQPTRVVRTAKEPMIQGWTPEFAGLEEVE